MEAAEGAIDRTLRDRVLQRLESVLLEPRGEAGQPPPAAMNRRRAAGEVSTFGIREWATQPDLR